MIRVRVPATSANLGPGYDCFGLAWQCYNELFFLPGGEGLRISGCPAEYQNEDNLAWQAYRRVLEQAGLSLREDLEIRFGASEIPVCRGLGSSAALIAAGAAAANAIHGLHLSPQALLDACTAVEGHPDNAAPALFGGLTASSMDGSRALTVSFPLSEALSFAVMIPDFQLSTAKARAVLPERIPRSDGVFNVSRAALLLHALGSGDLDMLRAAMEDRLHQPYRWGLIEHSGEARRLAEEAGAAAVCISGAGPTMLCAGGSRDFIDRLRPALAAALPGWELRELRPERQGTRCEKV